MKYSIALLLQVFFSGLPVALPEPRLQRLRFILSIKIIFL